MKKPPALKWVALALYGAAVAAWLIVSITLLVLGRGLAPRTLHIADFESDNLAIYPQQDGGARIVSTNPDPQLIFRFDAPQRVGRLTFDAVTTFSGGEMVLYYTTAPGADFSETQKLWAKQTPDGLWYFDIDRTVAALRLDPGTTPGVQWQVGDITLNAPRPAAALLLPDARGIAALLLLPALLMAAFAALRSIWYVLRPARAAAN